MTYNIAAGGGDIDRIAAAIGAAAPDVVALQEVDVHWSARSDFVDQAARLGAALGMDVRFGEIYRAPGAVGAPDRRFGLAVLSRYPIVEFTNRDLPRLSTQTADTVARPLPGLLDAEIDVGGVRVRMLNTHLDYRADPAVRALQVAAMLAVLPEQEHVVLAGDLNAQPDAPELQPLFARLRDAAALGVPEHTYPAHAPTRRIDYVLVSHHFRVLGARVPPDTASDHRPVVVDVRLR
jgi:endonuclease/exonuclease/phosphatase family metal-dependent hydrolase